MTGRHQPQYTRYSSSNSSYSNAGGNLNIPFPPQNNSSQQNHGTPSPYSSSSSPGYHSPNVQRYNTPLKKYSLQPPPRKLPLSRTMTVLGYPGMFPQKPGQEEDNLTEQNVRHGFQDKPVVSNEHTCAHDIVYGKLQDDNRLLNELGSFMVQVLQRQNNIATITGPSSFRAPARTTLIDSKREQWMQELASGLTPLRKLARNVPHGFKGEKLLDALAAKQVPLLRATWYIKIVGLSEMSQRSASNATNSMDSQSVQWTVTVTGHLRRQLNELTPNNQNNPPTQQQSRNKNDNTPKPWSSPESRARFEQRWSYSVRLARWQYFEGLLNQRTFLKWTLDTLAGSTSFEVLWLVLTGIIQDYIDEYKRNRTLSKILIEILIKSYSALVQYNNKHLQDENAKSAYHGLEKDIQHTLQSLFLSTPDMFVVPKLYHQYRNLFELIFGQENSSNKQLTNISHVMSEYWIMIKARNEVFCGTLEENEMKNTNNNNHTRQAETSEISGDEERVVHILDSIGKNADSNVGLLLNGEQWMDIRGHSAQSASKAIFGTMRVESFKFIKLISIMCQWATSESRYGDWKAYLVTSVLLAWRDQDKSQERNDLLQDALIRFLDNETKKDHVDDNDDRISAGNEYQLGGEYATTKSSHAVIYLFDILIRTRLFSYQKYLLRLIARGDLEPKRRHIPQVQKCLYHLASFPLLSPAPAYLLNQRHMALYGLRTDAINNTEAEILEKLKRIARLALTGYDHGDADCLFGPDSKDMTQSMSVDSAKSFQLAFSDDIYTEFVNTMKSTTRYSLLDFTSNWLQSQVKRFVVKSIQIGEDNWRVMTSPGSSLLNTRQFVAIVTLLDLSKDYLNIIELSLWVLEKSNDSTLYPYVIDTFRKYSNYWKLTNNGSRIINAIWQKHLNTQSRGNRERCIMMYMVQLVQEGYQIDDTLRSQLQQDLQIKAKLRGRYNKVELIKSELAQLANDPSHSTIQMVCESLGAPPQHASDWIGAILETCGEMLSNAAKEKSIASEASMTNGNELSPPLYEFHKLLRAYAQVISHVASQTLLTGQIDEIVIHWLCNNPIVLEDMNQPCSWVPVFLAILVSYNAINLDNAIKRFALLWFEQVGHECQQYQTNGTPEEGRLVVFCQNLIVLVRLLIIQSSNNMTRLEGETFFMPWKLRIEEYYRLEVQRQSQLASSLDRIEPMFALMEKLVMIATNLPLSSSLLQDLVMLRADLLQIGWFRQACIRDLNGVYQRFAAREAEASIEKRMKKKMLCIVDELIGGSLYSERQTIDTNPDFVDKLRRVFSNVSQWNEAQCRVQINLLLDNISLSDGNYQNPNNPHILGDDVSMMDSMSTMPTANNNKDLESFVYFFYDIVLSDGKEEREHAKAQRRFQFFKNLIHEIREPVLLELLNHGARLLEGSNDQAFPENILLMQATEPGAMFDSCKYTYRAKAFLNITQHMLAENIWSNDQKIELVKTIFKQIVRFKSGLSVYKVMQGANVCYSDAYNALQLVKNNVDMAIALLVTEGLPESVASDLTDDKKLSLQDIRTSLLIRLRLVVPFASLIWEHPKEDECDILEWIRVLVPLLVNPVVHGNGSQERFFEFTLDFVSLLVDEVPKALKKASLVLLGSMQSESAAVPAIFHSRVKRIMPFLTHNVYLSSTKMASSMLGQPTTHDPQQQQQHVENCLEQCKPWEWLEDYASEPPQDNDAPISLSLFNAKKAKRTDSTYVRWFKFGFEGTSSTKQHISNLGEQGPQKYTEATDENGFIFIIDQDDEEMGGQPPSSIPKKRRADMEEGELP